MPARGAGIDSADLVLNKVARPDPDGVRRVTDVVTFDITILNDGSTGVVTLPLEDTYDPTALQFLSATPAPDLATPLGTLTWYDLLNGNGFSDPFIKDESITVTVSFRALKTGTTTNTATVDEALDEYGNQVPEKIATANVTVTEDANPAIDISKTPDLQYLLVGGTASFTITVTNTGNLLLTNVTVSDPRAPNCNRTFPSLAPGAVQTYTCTQTNVSADFTNIASVTGTPPAGPPVTDSDDAVVDVINPGIDIQKTPDSQQARVGDTVTFTITVRNTGDALLRDVTVSDPLAPNCNRTFTSLAAGATQTYTCTQANVTADLTNIASVTGTPPTGPAVTDSDNAVVDVINPAIDIQKTPDSQLARVGDTVTFTITVRNTGDVPLTNVTVTDPLAPNCDRLFTSLAVGGTQTYSCALTNVSADFTNIASVTGKPPVGPAVTDNDNAAVDVINPGIDIQKTPDSQQARVGTTVTFTITVRNTGDVALTNVVVSDPAATGCNRTFGSLAVGEVQTYTCTQTNVSADFTNIASVTGTPPVGPAVTDNDNAVVDVIRPAIDIEKTPDSQQARVGDTVTFTITVRNTGDVALTNVTVTDPLAPNCDRLFASLAVGGVQTYTCTRASVSADFTNIASVTGTPPVGPAVTDNDNAVVDVINPAIDIEKTPDSQQARVGDTVTFTIIVRNTGDVALTNVTVNDPLAPNCNRTITSLAVGGTQTYTCTLTNVSADFTNVATVTGTPPVGPVVTDNDNAVVDVINPGIDIQKTPDGQQARVGATVTFTITVRNTGDVPLTNVTVTDPLASNCNRTFTSLAVGGTQTYTCTLANVSADFTNIASVTGTPPVGPAVTDSDTAPVDVINPGIDIEKTPDSQQARLGDTVTFTITVRNTGDVALTNVTVTDPLAPNCNRTFTSLAVGGTQTYSCTQANVTADFTNNASVTGTPPVGPAVTDSDNAVVDVINPALDIQKTPDSQLARVGDTVTFTITVRNTGDVALTNVTVSDPLAPNCDRLFASLAVGGVQTYSCTRASVAADFTNIASVTGTPPVGPAVTDSDDAVVDVINPAIDIQKTPDAQQVIYNGTATFTIQVQNIGDVPLTNVVVSDPLAPDCGRTFASLAVNQVQSYTCVLAGLTADMTNVASVTGTPPLGPAVTDSDDAYVAVEPPTGVQVLGFQAAADAGQVVLTWQAHVPDGSAPPQFDVHRLAEGGAWEWLTPEGPVGPAPGGDYLDYRFSDASAQRGQSYQYRLTADGADYGPWPVVVPGKTYRVLLPLLSR